MRANCSIFVLIVSALSIPAIVKSEGSDVHNCATSLAKLEQALYDTGKNKLLLNQFFYKEHEPYAKITYHFEDENGNLSQAGEESCKVTYLWATGGFLLIQPPSVFTYTSLFFFHTRRTNFDLDLRLPFECRALVVDATADNETCSCTNRDNSLDQLSQQVHI